MKHKITTFLFLITLGFSFNLFFTESSQAEVCAKTNSGIIMKPPASVTQTYLDGSTTIDAPFNYADGYVDSEFSTNNTNACNEMPEYYGVLINRIAICKEDPYVDGANPVLTSCVDIVNKPANTTYTEVSPDIENDLVSEGLIDSDLIIPQGSYPYAFVLVNNKLKVKHVQKYVKSNGTDADMWGFGSGSTGEKGTYCYTLEKTTTYSNSIWDGAYKTAMGSGTIVQAGDGTNATMACNDTKATADTSAEWATEIIDHLGGDITDKTALVSSADYSIGTGVDAGVDLANYMLKAGGLVLADNVDNAVRIGAIYRYANPIVISENTVGIKFDFGTTYGSSIDAMVDGSDKVWMKKTGVDPFIMKILTRERGAGGAARIGSWR